MIIPSGKPKIKVVKCKDCGVEFEQNASARFPRKYCKKCGDVRKKAYEDIWKVEADDCEEA